MGDLKKLQELCKEYSILYVEDNEALRTNAKKLLHKFFPVVSVAKDGQEGLEKFKEKNFPIVITDIKMPNMDGVTFFKSIKKIAPKTEVMVISAYDEQAYLLEMIEHHVFKFLKKPINVTSLTDALYDVVSKLKEQEIASREVQTKEEACDIPTKEVQEEYMLHDTKLLFSILQELKTKEQKLEVHNYYKGLSITKDAQILEVNKESIKIATSYMQQKAIQYEGKTILVSEKFPFPVESTHANHLSFDKHNIELSELHFTKTSPIDRDTIRVFPQGQYTISLFMDELEIQGEIKIEDISINSMRLSITSLPAGLRQSKNIHLQASLEKGTFVLDTKVSLFRIDELERRFDLVFLFENIQKAQFMKYITKRQMEIIREFKGLQNG